MKIHHYDRVTGVYLGSADADPSPVEPGKFLIPAFSTEVEPPAPETGFALVFKSGKWSTVAVQPPPPPPVPAPLSPAERGSLLRNRVVLRANETAMRYGYDSIDEAVSYAEEAAVPQYQIEGRAFRAWRSLLWQAFDTMLAQVDGGIVPEPKNDDELFSMLPAFVSPHAGPAPAEP